jgi:DNA-nicking Smr family endonuclease
MRLALSMKKSKHHRNDNENSNNNPFKSLKSFTPAPEASQEKKIPTPKQKEKTDDTILFLRAVQGTRAIRHRFENQQEAAEEKGAEHQEKVDKDEQRLFLQAIEKIGETFRDESPNIHEDEPGRRSRCSRIREFKRGTIVLSDELDLHGYSKDEALGRLERFITGAYRSRYRAVLVITGKGINSADGPVLKAAVAAWLRGRGSGMVAEFAPAPRNKGGSGALVVFLKNK